MVYKVIGLMSGSSLDGLDLAYVHLQDTVTGSKEGSRKWEYTLVHTACYPYPAEWRQRLSAAAGLPALDYQLLHTEYGRYLGEQVLQFIGEFGLHFQVQLIASHGHTSFHLPAQRMTAHLGDGAAIAAVTGINVVSDLRAMDLALGGQGAPIVPIAEKLLLPGYDLFLNLGGIANISAVSLAAGGFIAYDVCPANRVLNELAMQTGQAFDAGGAMAAAGKVDEALLSELNELAYYGEGYPKSLPNTFGMDIVLPLVRAGMGTTADGLRTYVEHAAMQIALAADGIKGPRSSMQMLVTGGGAHNTFLMERLSEMLARIGIETVVPDAALIDYKEALAMALIGVLRWREENNVLASVTGASRDSIGGAVWIGQEA